MFSKRLEEIGVSSNMFQSSVMFRYSSTDVFEKGWKGGSCRRGTLRCFQERELGGSLETPRVDGKLQISYQVTRSIRR